MMKRTMLLLSIFLLVTLISGWVNLAEAQQAGKVYRIGVSRGAKHPASYMEAFKRGLRDHGYIEGENIVIEWKHGRDAAAELVRLGVHVIVATGTGRIRRAKKATKTIPIVMAPSADAVRGGLIDSLARPGGNVTGLTMITPELAAKRLGLLKEAVDLLPMGKTANHADNTRHGHSTLSTRQRNPNRLMSVTTPFANNSRRRWISIFYKSLIQ